MNKLLPALVPLLAPLLGYLVCWFFWGVPLPWMLLLLLGGAALWTFVPRKGQGGWTFSRAFLTVILLGLSLWVIGAGVVGVMMVSLPNNPLPIGWPQLAPLLLAGAGVVAACWAMISQMAGRVSRERGQPVVVPWLWLAGMLAFAFFPAVRVDCRGLDSDTYRRDQRGFLSANGGYWARHPEQLPGRAELPAGFIPAGVATGVARCDQDARGRPRTFSFRAASPLLLVYLSDRQGPGQRYVAAAFTPGDHRKLTRWAAAPQPYGIWTNQMPYLNPFWEVGRVLPEVPAPIAAQLSKSP